ncbi:MAG: DUF1080 domain-containing protein [Terricaulis sp.]
MRLALAIFALAITACGSVAQELPLPQATEVWSPVPAHVAPGAEVGAPPSDAIVLFGANTLSGQDVVNGMTTRDLVPFLGGWESVNGGPARWIVEDGVLTVAPGTGDIRTTERFGDVQLHIEWRPPVLPANRTGQDRGNSGVFLQERYEVQVLDTLENVTYSNGQAGSIYKQHIPLVNASRPAGEWQSYDILYTAPRFGADGALTSPARVTVLHNGVLIQNNVTLTGGTTYIGAPSYEVHGDGALRLQDHGAPVSFRNIWVRRL